MSKRDLNFTRNIGIMAHVDAGKTTTTERILYYTGISHKIGEVHIGSHDGLDGAGAGARHHDHVCCHHLLLEVRRLPRSTSLTPPDTWTSPLRWSVPCMCSTALWDCSVPCPVWSRSLRPTGVWRTSNVPRIGFVNKMDRSGADFFNVLEQIREMLGANPVPLQVPIGAEDDFKGVVDLLTGKAMVWNEEDKGMTFTEVPIPDDLVGTVNEYREKLVEAVAEQDDTLMEKFFEDPDSITEAEMVAAIRKATIAMDITPMLCGSAFKNKGVQTMLDAVMRYLPSPYDIGEIVGMNPDDEEEQVVRHSDRTSRSPASPSRLPPTRSWAVCASCAPTPASCPPARTKNTRSDKKERISRIFQMHSNKQNPIDQLEAGDIGAVVGFKDIRTGDTLCSEGHPITLESMTFPDPVIGIAIEPKSQADIDKLGNGLAKLSEEDPTFRVHTDEDSGQTVISGMGELHLDVLVDRLKREFKVECNQGQPQVAYKEAIFGTTDHREVYKKQSGGRGKFADIIVKIGPSPTPEEEGLVFKNSVKGGNVPKEFVPSVEKGFKDAMVTGVLAGYPMDSMSVEVHGRILHAVDSDQLSLSWQPRWLTAMPSRAATPRFLSP